MNHDGEKDRKEAAELFLVKIKFWYFIYEGGKEWKCFLKERFVEHYYFPKNIL